MPEENQTKKLVMVAIIAFVLGFLVAWLVWGNSNINPSDNGAGVDIELNENGNNNNNGNSNGNVPTDGTNTGNNVEVGNQTPGNSVTVSDVSVSGPSWVAVREVVGQVPGSILGAKLVSESQSEVTVNLLRGTVEGGSYQVLIFEDNGDGVFNHQTDVAVEATAVPFTTSATSQ